MKKILASIGIFIFAGILIFMVWMFHPYLPLFANYVMGQIVVIEKLPADFRCMAAYSVPWKGVNRIIFKHQGDDLTLCMDSMTDARLNKYRTYDEDKIFEILFPTGSGYGLLIRGKHFTPIEPSAAIVIDRGIMRVGNDDFHYMIGSATNKSTGEPIQVMKGYVLPNSNKNRIIKIYASTKNKTYNIAATKELLDSISNFQP